MQVSLRPFSLPLVRPLGMASGRIERRDGLLVVVDADGVRGVGEATPLSGWTESLDACTSALEAARDSLVEAVPDASRSNAVAARSRLEGTPAARHGLALALADRDARQRGRSLYRHLGGDRSVESIPANATVGDGDVGETVERARVAIEAGFTCLKVKVGARPIDVDGERLAAVRDAVGPDVALRADANGAWDVETARVAFDAFADVGVEYVEQPLPAADLAGHAELRGGPVAVALDESLARGGPGPDAAVAAGAADVLVVKPMVLGGLDRARAVATMATDAGLGAVVTTTVDGVVARVGAVHLAASLAPDVPAGLATVDRLAEDLAPDPAPIVDGRAQVPQGPGLGVDVDGWST